ncbi:MAG: hypothetical protein HY751_02830 [Nitrospinae bacterium]|nr:hypothetical protein [Nitrospinota bacterium]
MSSGFYRYSLYFLMAFALAFPACFGGGSDGPKNIVLGPGWHNLERSPDGKNWWLWTKDKGQIVVEVDTDVTLTMRGGVGSIQLPNKIEVTLNGQKAATWEIGGDKYEQKPFQPLPLNLKVGRNIIEFTSANKATTIPTDTRELAIAIDDISLTAGDGKVVFALQ